MEHIGKDQLKLVKTKKFNIHLFNSITNLKIILVTSPLIDNADEKLEKVYFLYSQLLRNNWRYIVVLKERTTDQLQTVHRTSQGDIQELIIN